MVEELHRRLATFRAGDGQASGAWLVAFQNADEAWPICAEALRAGPRTGAEGEFLDAFCAQTLATLARALTCRCPRSTHGAFRGAMEALLALHLPPSGRPSVWRQLALAITCADLWFGSWSPRRALQAEGLPSEVRMELLLLPTELLFCERALPLSDVALWRHAAAGLLEACGPVFAHLLNLSAAEHTRAAQALQAVAAWLRAARLAFHWLEGSDEAEALPVRALAACGAGILEAAGRAPFAAAEVVQQLARWRRCDADVSPLLRALLGQIFTVVASVAATDRAGLHALLPLLADLALDRWPRAALGDIDLDWRPIAYQAVLTLRAAVSLVGEGGDVIGREVEASLAVWHNFAITVRSGTREWEDEAEYGGPHSQWRAAYDRLASTESLPQLFGLFAQEILVLLRLPSSPRADEIRVLWDARATAQSALSAWACLIGDSPAWREATWAPLRRMSGQLAAVVGGGAPAEDVWQEAEVVLWFSHTLAASWCEPPGAAPIASAVFEVGTAIDAAPEPWRSLLHCAGCELAATGPQELCERLISWMLERSPYKPGAHALLEFTELPYAQALEMACRQLPQDAAHSAVAEHVLGLALAEVPPNALHRYSSDARALLLRAMPHVMRGDMARLCCGLEAQVLPQLRAAAAAEAADAAQKRDAPWHAARTLFATLAALLPPARSPPITDAAHAVAACFRLEWPAVEEALLRWPVSAINDQPLAAASEVLGKAAATLPALLPEILQLIARSVVQRPQFEPQLRALREAVLNVPCPPLDAARSAELLAGALFVAADGVFGRPETRHSPSSLVAFFSLLEAAVSDVASLPYGDALCQSVLAQPNFIGHCLALFCETLPTSPAADATEHMLRFVVQLVVLDDQDHAQPHRRLVGEALPAVCAAVCRALAVQEKLAAWAGMVEAAELLYRAADAFPAEFPGALSAGLEQVVEVPVWSRERFRRHVEQRATWPKRSAWVGETHQIVQEWHRERRQGRPSADR